MCAEPGTPRGRGAADDLLALARQLGLGRYGTYPSELEGEVLREEHSEK